MKKILLSVMAMFCLSVCSMAQEVSDYNIKVEKASLTKFLDLTEPAANKMDAWQSELQTKIDEAVKLSGNERADKLKVIINEYLDTVKGYLREETFKSYLTVFRNTMKNKHIVELMTYTEE